MKILLACDKFKGSLDSLKVNTAIEKGLKKKHPNITTVLHPLADGGDGTLVVLEKALQLPFVYQPTIDPLGRPIMAPYLKDEKTAYFELAAASGIFLLKGVSLAPLRTTTLGTGRIMRAALDKGTRNLVLGLGGSCTTDAGLGIAYELGVRFFDKNKHEIIPAGGNLLDIATLDIQQMVTIDHLTILCDVSNPLYGPNGAAHIFARQKGASTEEIHLLDRGLQHVAQLIEKYTGRSVSELPGGGAAGGIAAGLTGFFKVKIVNGFDFIKKLTDLEAQIKLADLVITGEGLLDKTSLDGKVVGGVASLCKQYGKPLVAVVGGSKLSEAEKESLGLDQVYTVVERAGSVEVAIRDAAIYLEEIGGSVLW